MNKYHDKIKCIGHLCKKDTAEYLDIPAIVKVANQYGIALEFNSTYFHKKETNLDQLEIMLKTADFVYVNSDAHMLSDLKNNQEAFDFLKKQGFIQ